MLTLDQIKKAHGPREWTIPVPAWGGDVRCRRLSATDYIELSAMLAAETPTRNEDYLTAVIERSLLDEAGQPLIGPADRHLLTDNPLLVFELGQTIVDRNGMDRQKRIS